MSRRLQDAFLALLIIGLIVFLPTVEELHSLSIRSAPIAAQVPPAVGTNVMITDAGWECISGARVADGKLVISGGATGTATLNDYALRLQTGEDLSISMTIEADLEAGFAGLTFWNSQPPAGPASQWYTTAVKISLGLTGGRVYIAVFDGTSSMPAFTYSGRQTGVKGPVTLNALREGDMLVLRVDGMEAARTKVLGPVTGGPLYFGPNVAKGKTLIVDRLIVSDGAHPNGVEIVRALATAAPVTPAAAAASLRTAATDRNRLIGAAFTSRQMRWDQPARDLAAREFNLVAAGDMLGWQQLRPTRKEFQFCRGDQLVAFAEANKMAVHGLHLAWAQNPDWLMQGNFSRDELIALLKEHIQTVVGHYRGRVTAWNVVNEVFEFNNTGRLAVGNDQIWMRIIGPEYIDMAFRWAHEADPQAILIFNSAGDEGTRCLSRCGPGNANGSRNNKADALYDFVKGMLKRGVPINGVGMQTHWGAQWDRSAPTVDPASVAAQMKRLGDLGLQVWITEMDAPIVKPVTRAKLADQAKTYGQMAKTCFAASNCKAFIVWGIDDGHYLEPPALARNGSDQVGQWAAGYLFDETYRPKSAYDAIATALRGR